MIHAIDRRILISYRRSDTGAVAGHLSSILKRRFGKDRVFIDVDNIPFGVDFRDHIRSVMDKCDVVIVMIGDAWAGASEGSRRIDDAVDYFRIEIETALIHKITVMPVLVSGSVMPLVSQLPNSISQLAYLHAAPLRVGQDFDAHASRIIDGIIKSKTVRKQPANHPQNIPISVLVAVAEWLFTALVIYLCYSMISHYLGLRYIDQPYWLLFSLASGTIVLLSDIVIRYYLKWKLNLLPIAVVNIVPFFATFLMYGSEPLKDYWPEVMGIYTAFRMTAIYILMSAPKQAFSGS